jgi:serine/threonine protein kinase
MAGKTQPGMLMGTIGYMSPEQVKGIEIRPHPTSFHLAASFEMLTGKPPFLRNSYAETLAAILNDPPSVSVCRWNGAG